MQPAHILDYDHVILRYIKYMRHLIDKPSVMIWTVSFMQLAHSLTGIFFSYWSVSSICPSQYGVIGPRVMQLAHDV